MSTLKSERGEGNGESKKADLAILLRQHHPRVEKTAFEVNPLPLVVEADVLLAREYGTQAVLDGLTSVLEDNINAFVVAHRKTLEENLAWINAVQYAVNRYSKILSLMQRMEEGLKGITELDKKFLETINLLQNKIASYLPQPGTNINNLDTACILNSDYILEILGQLNSQLLSGNSDFSLPVIDVQRTLIRAPSRWEGTYSKSSFGGLGLAKIGIELNLKSILEKYRLSLQAQMRTEVETEWAQSELKLFRREYPEIESIIRKQTEFEKLKQQIKKWKESLQEILRTLNQDGTHFGELNVLSISKDLYPIDTSSFSRKSLTGIPKRYIIGCVYLEKQIGLYKKEEKTEFLETVNNWKTQIGRIGQILNGIIGSNIEVNIEGLLSNLFSAVYLVNTIIEGLDDSTKKPPLTPNQKQILEQYNLLLNSVPVP